MHSALRVDYETARGAAMSSATFIIILFLLSVDSDYSLGKHQGTLLKRGGVAPSNRRTQR